MGALDDRSNVRSLIRRFWWVGLIVLFVLILLCLFSANPNALARVFNPPPPEEESTQAPTDTVTQPPVTDEATDEPTDAPTDPPTDEATPLVTDPPPVTDPPTLTEVVTEAACHCEGVDLVCPTGVSYNSVECGGGGICICLPDKTLVCPDGTFAPFNPACGVGGGDQQCSRTEICGDRICQPWCGEDPRTCPGDC